MARSDDRGRTYIVTDDDAPLKIDSSTPVRTASAATVPWGYQQIANATLASATALTVPDGAGYAIIQVESKSVRWRDDGVDPTGSVGMLLPADSAMVYDGDLTQLRFIRTESGATLNVSYYSNLW